jgi:hypothetical protein
VSFELELDTYILHIAFVWRATYLVIMQLKGDKTQEIAE